jgi:hypothetical protein
VRPRSDFRFTQMDSYFANQTTPMSLHKYLYARADDINVADPSGHEGLWDTKALAPIAVGLSLVEGLETGYANAVAAPLDEFGAAFAVGVASAVTTEALSFAGYNGAFASGAGNTLLKFGNNILSRIQGGFFFFGGGGQTPIGIADGGIGLFFSKRGAWVGLEGNLAWGVGVQAGVGGGLGWGWGTAGPGLSGGLGPITAVDVGPIAFDGFYDALNNQTGMGISWGEGFPIVAGGIVISGPPPWL